MRILDCHLNEGMILWDLKNQRQDFNREFTNLSKYTVCFLQGAFRRVKAEIQAVVNDLTLKVRSRMNANESSDILEDLQLLKKLGESSQTLQVNQYRISQILPNPYVLL